MSSLDWDAAEAALEAAFDWGKTEPGGAMVVFDLSGLRLSRARGVESLATLTPFSLDTISRFASVTKQVFASFVLSHPETISLDDPLSQHLPMLSAPLGAISVGRALDMSGGVPDTRECLTLIGLSSFDQSFAPELLDFHARMPRPNYRPGTEVHYSNGGYRLVEEAMRAHGLLFRDFVAGQLRDGMGLALHAMEMWTDPLAGLAPGYWHDDAGWHEGFQGMHLSAAGSLAGSVRALAGWGRALLANEGVFEGRLAALSAPRHLLDGTATHYGLGMRDQFLGQKRLVGHGGSQPGYKSYILLDPHSATGCAIVANRDDANTSDIAQQVMAALLGEPLPEPRSDLTPGLYVSETGGDWLEVRGNAVSRLDDEVALFPNAEGTFASPSPTGLLELRMEGDAIVGRADHAPVRFLPAQDAAPAPSLEGEWLSDSYGARFTIEDGHVVMGAGPRRFRAALRAIGRDTFLFERPDSHATHRICLHRLDEHRVTLKLSRAKVIDYRRV
ncbi:serine hydrolase domain-containing protein [Paenirhodobacter enshiensis]|uniref:serine hydrolase domain-containing protein n=1 Tax=Paenirhodobacter enshiensis TaxID=1105367 RepID=UPI0035B31EEF